MHRLYGLLARANDGQQRQAGQGHKQLGAGAAVAVDQRGAQHEPVQRQAAQAIVGGQLAAVIGGKGLGIGAQGRDLNHPAHPGAYTGAEQRLWRCYVQRLEALRGGLADDADTVDHRIDPGEQR